MTGDPRVGRGRAPRVLTIMGSGETAPTMARVHRELFKRLGPGAIPAALLDTPYGFQENADEVTSRALEYFGHNVGHPMTLASFRAADGDPLVRATALARAREARYLFTGPGSPSYALAQWRDSEIPAVVADKLEHGGIVTFASAAALTLGSHTVPVYEIYKVGAAPYWLEGLDLMRPLGLPVAVVPHYDNAEGGTHDTRFCYLGERRLRMLEADLPEDTFILGVDSHTALVLDLDARTASVQGIGGVTVRVAGSSRVFDPGTTVPVDALTEAAGSLRDGVQAEELQSGAGSADGSPGSDIATAGVASGSSRPRTATPLIDEARVLEARFETALERSMMPDAARAVLALEELMVEWSSDTDNTQVDQARSVFRSLVVRLAERADGASSAAGERAAERRLTPLVRLLVDLRSGARAAGDFDRADAIRRTLVEAGIELRDGADGTTWVGSGTS